MKKILLLLLLGLLLPILSLKEVSAGSYETFQEINLDSGMMLKDMDKESLKKYYSKVTNRKFWGWNVYYVNSDIHCKFISETIFSYYNDGKTAITYTYSSSQAEVQKFSISASGSIALSKTGTVKTFKNGLSGALKIEGNYSYTSEKKEETTLKIVVDPQTEANLYIVGEGKLSNGVGAYYVFWHQSQLGGYEYFLVTTSYTRLEVLPI